MKEKTYEGTKKTQNGLKRMFFSVLAILLQAVFMVYMFTRLNEYAAAINTTTSVLAIILVLGLYNREQTASMTTPWIILILAFPIMGVSLYLLVGLNGAPNKMRARFEEVDSMLLPCLPENADILSDMYEKVPQAAGISTYLAKNALYPVYQNTDVTYYDQASKGLEAQLSDLSKARKFIFMEYHAIEDKESWHRIQKVLMERVQAGVEVRVFYDDMGSIFFIDRDFSEKMEKLGIKCRVFNPVAPAFNMFLNNRDHRKITVIDGKIAYTGGYNLANEYFNVTHPYGIWKDTGIRLEEMLSSRLPSHFSRCGMHQSARCRARWMYRNICCTMIMRQNRVDLSSHMQTALSITSRLGRMSISAWQTRHSVIAGLSLLTLSLPMR